MRISTERKKATKWLRVAFLYGAIVDLLAAAQMIFPALFKLTMPDLTIDTGLIFGMRYGAPLMLGWTGLLIWAMRRPLERRDIAILTILPVMVGYTMINIWMVSVNLIKLEQMAPLLVSQVILYALLGTGYWNARKVTLLEQGM